jgi:anti-sigma factor ChrR (cupin superfamily)
VLSSKPFIHLNDDQLLAYLEGEMSIARMRTIRNHLRICWNCRSALAELEAQVEAISHLLLARTKHDAERSDRAKERFLDWRNTYERQRGLFSKFLSLQLFRHALQPSWSVQAYV